MIRGETAKLGFRHFNIDYLNTGVYENMVNANRRKATKKSAARPMLFQF